jgi:metallo-beta-lactamase class B
MKKIFFLVFSIGSMYGQSKMLDINYLTTNTYVYTNYHAYDGTMVPANGLYVVTNDGVILIDALWDETQTQPLLDSIEARHHQKVKLCVVTHFHDDRTAGLDILKKQGIKTYSSFLTYTKGKEKGEKTAEFPFYSDTTFNLGGVEFQTFFPGHGHSPDNIVIWFPKTRILYGGCFIKSLDSKGLGNLEDADVASWQLAIKKTMKKFKSPKFVIPGHYSWTNKNALMHTLYLLTGKKK